jgi:hypothetical protein
MRSVQPHWAADIAWFAFLLLAAGAVFYLGLYGVGMHSPYWGDDYQLVFPHPAEHVFYFFAHTPPGNGFYRPLAFGAIALVQAWFGMATWPIAFANILIHVFLAWLVFRFMATEGLGTPQAVIGSLFMLVSQATLQAVAENDTTSQIAGTALGCVCLYLLRNSAAPPANASGWAGKRRTKYIASVAFFSAALLFKETSLAFVVLAPAVIALCGRQRVIVDRAKILVAWVVPYAAVTIVYLWVRTAVLGSWTLSIGSDSRYSVHWGSNVIKNFVELAVASSIPVSSVWAYSSVVERRLGVLVMIAAVTLLFLGIVACGVRNSRNWGTALVMIGFACAAVGPASVIKQTSELYVYSAMPFFSVAVGIGLGELIDWHRRRIVAPIVSVLVVALLVSHVVADHAKAVLLDENGQRAATLLPQITQRIRHAPVAAPVYLVNPVRDRVQYSNYLVSGFNVFADGKRIFDQMSGRPNLRVTIVNAGRLPAVIPRDSVVLTYDLRNLHVHSLAR